MPVTTYSRAGQWGPTTVIDMAGRPRPGTVVALYLPDGSTLATLYTGSAKAAAAANPLTADARAAVTLFADPGPYLLRATFAGVTREYAIEVPVDPVEAALDEDIALLMPLAQLTTAATVSGDWDFTAALTRVGVEVATVDDVAAGDLVEATARMAADAVIASGGPLNALAVGCAGDGKYSASGAINVGVSPTTLTGPSFAVADVGKKITVQGAGVAGANLYTTIASRNSAVSVELADAAATTVSGARTAWGTDDSAAIQAALLLGASLLFGDRTFYLHNTGIDLTGRKRFYGVGKNYTFGGGGSGKGTCFVYTGSGAGLRVNNETATAATTDVNMGDFTVDCINTGDVGIRIGRATGSPKSVTGRIVNVRASGAVTGGWDLVAAQLLSFYDCEGSSNVGDGWIYNDTAPGSNAALKFFGCRGENNTGRGQFIKSAASVGHYGCIYQSNGLEGTHVQRSVANPVLGGITWDGKCYWEVNNSGRAGTGWAQFKMESLGSAIITRIYLNDPHFVTPGAGNFHIDLQKGELSLRNPDFNSTTPAVNVSNSSVSRLTVYGQNDPTVYYTVGANAPCVWMRTETGVFTYYTNVAGTPTAQAVFPDETVQALGSSGSSKTVSATAGTFVTVTLTAACTFTFSAPTSGVAHSFTMLLAQDGATGGRVATWPGSVKWPNGSAPVLSTAVSAVDMVAFTTIDGGTTWYGTLLGLSFA